jgi:Tfp pilus assembly protein PilF
MYRGSLKIKPDQAEARFRLVVIYLKQGDRAAASEQHREPVKLDPDMAQKLADRFR